MTDRGTAKVRISFAFICELDSLCLAARPLGEVNPYLKIEQADRERGKGCVVELTEREIRELLAHAESYIGVDGVLAEWGNVGDRSMYRGLYRTASKALAKLLGA